jgi:hypothetical protein
MHTNKKLHALMLELKRDIATLTHQHNQAKFLVDTLKSELRRITRINKNLMDRFMAKDFEQLQIYAESEVPTQPYEGLDEDEDEENAGEVLEVETKR